MKNIKLYATNDAFNADTTLGIPYVTLTEDDKKVHYSSDRTLIGKFQISEQYINAVNEQTGLPWAVFTARKDIFDSFKVNGQELITEATPYQGGGTDGIYGEITQETLPVMIANSLYDQNPTIGEYEFKAIIKNGVDSLTECFIMSAVSEITKLPKCITKIGTQCFSNSMLQSINFGCYVTELYPYSFGYCPALTSVTLPVSIESVDQLAFHNSNRLMECVIPENAYGKDITIGDRAFDGCDYLDGLVLSKSVKYIGWEFMATGENPLHRVLYYRGTKQEWNAIEKHEQWFGNDLYAGEEPHYPIGTITFDIHCSDGLEQFHYERFE